MPKAFSFSYNVYLTNCHGLKAFDFASEAGCELLECRPTHKYGNCSHLVFSDTTGGVACNVGIPFGSSDHCYVFATIITKQTVPDVSFSRKIYIKSRADWGGILHDFSIINWPDVCHQKNSIASFNDICTRTLDKHIPTQVINFSN